MSKCVYKLILFRNIVESKAHKEDILTYKAFEKMLKFRPVGFVIPPKRISTAEIQGHRITQIRTESHDPSQDDKIEEYMTINSDDDPEKENIRQLQEEL